MGNHKSTRTKEAVSWVVAIAIAFVVAFLARYYIFSPFMVQGESMMPNLHNNDRLIVNKIGAELGTPERFDVIVFRAPDANADYVKRVIGLPGDKIVYKKDTLSINGKSYKEPYLKKYKEQLPPQLKLTGDFTLNEVTGKERVPENKLFVMGDNRQNSKDSRMFGFVSKDAVIGIADLKYWPLSDFEWIGE